jgi:hypothetical protein
MKAGTELTAGNFAAFKNKKTEVEHENQDE